MARQTLDNNMAASVFRAILNDNFLELYNNKAPNNHASSYTDFGAASTTHFGHIKINNANGLNINNGVLSLAAATTSQMGAVQLVDNASTNDSTKAATAAALKAVKDGQVVTYAGDYVPSSGLGKHGDIFIKYS